MNTVIAELIQYIQDTKTFPKCYVGRNGKQKTTHTSVWIAQDVTESRVPRLNVHTKLNLSAHI